MADILSGTLELTGVNAKFRGLSVAWARTELTQENYSSFEVPHTEMRIWDAVQTLLTTAGSDDLGLTAGAFATGIWYITAGSLGSAGATTRYCRFRQALPMNYVAGQAVKFVLYAGITGGTPQAASVSCTLDLEAYEFGTNVLVSGSDLVTTSATSINSTTFADTEFELTPTNLAAGDILDVRITIACNDAVGTAANVVPAISRLALKCHTKG